MEEPYAIHLSGVQWQFFGTLTFRKRHYERGVRLSMFFAFMRRICKDHKIHFKRVLWVLREEEGERTGRLHYHFLLAGLPKSAVTLGYKWALVNYWRNLWQNKSRRKREVIWKPKYDWPSMSLASCELRGAFPGTDENPLILGKGELKEVKTGVDIRFFDATLAGCAYVLKGLSEHNVHETGKFGGNSDLTLSFGLQDKLRFVALR